MSERLVRPRIDDEAANSSRSLVEKLFEEHKAAVAAQVVEQVNAAVARSTGDLFRKYGEAMQERLAAAGVRMASRKVKSS